MRWLCARYWEDRYRKGEGSSVVAHYSRIASWRGEFVSWLAKHYGLRTLVDFGVGDGQQMGAYNQAPQPTPL